jgi:hypothetical protein
MFSATIQAEVTQLGDSSNNGLFIINLVTVPAGRNSIFRPALNAYRTLPDDKPFQNKQYE